MKMKDYTRHVPGLGDFTVQAEFDEAADLLLNEAIREASVKQNAAREADAKTERRVAQARARLRMVEINGADYFRPDPDCGRTWQGLMRTGPFIPAVVGLFDLLATAHVQAAADGKVICSRHHAAPLVHVILGVPRGEWVYRSQPVDYTVSGLDRQDLGYESAAHIAVIAGEYGLTWAKFQGVPFREFRHSIESTVWNCLGTEGNCDGDTAGVATIDAQPLCGLGIAVPGTGSVRASLASTLPAPVVELARRDAAVRVFAELVEQAGKALPMSDGLAALAVALAGPKRWDRAPGLSRVAWNSTTGRGGLSSVTEASLEVLGTRALPMFSALLGWVRETVGEDERTAPVRKLIAGTGGFKPPVDKTEMQILNEKLEALAHPKGRAADGMSFADVTVEVVTPGSVFRDNTRPRVDSVFSGLGDDS